MVYSLAVGAWPASIGSSDVFFAKQSLKSLFFLQVQHLEDLAADFRQDAPSKEADFLRVGWGRNSRNGFAILPYCLAL